MGGGKREAARNRQTGGETESRASTHRGGGITEGGQQGYAQTLKGKQKTSREKEFRISVSCTLIQARLTGKDEQKKGTRRKGASLKSRGKSPTALSTGITTRRKSGAPEQPAEAFHETARDEKQAGKGSIEKSGGEVGIKTSLKQRKMGGEM